MNGIDIKSCINDQIPKCTCKVRVRRQLTQSGVIIGLIENIDAANLSGERQTNCKPFGCPPTMLPEHSLGSRGQTNNAQHHCKCHCKYPGKLSTSKRRPHVDEVIGLVSVVVEMAKRVCPIVIYLGQFVVGK